MMTQNDVPVRAAGGRRTLYRTWSIEDRSGNLVGRYIQIPPHHTSGCAVQFVRGDGRMGGHHVLAYRTRKEAREAVAAMDGEYLKLYGRRDWPSWLMGPHRVVLIDVHVYTRRPAARRRR